jgi:hypothetical protein
MNAQTNLRIIKRGKSPPKEGDIFAMQLPSDRYIFGRVVLAEPPRQRAPGPGVYLIYIYKAESGSKQPSFALLSTAHLLLAPIWTNRLGWTKGYFHTVANISIQKEMLLLTHCFRRHDGSYLDEQGRQLSQPSDPCGEWGVVSYRWIDDHISDVLGIPRVPVMEGER